MILTKSFNHFLSQIISDRSLFFMILFLLAVTNELCISPDSLASVQSVPFSLVRKLLDWLSTDYSCFVLSLIPKAANQSKFAKKFNVHFGNLLEVFSTIQPNFFAKNSLVFQKLFVQSFEKFALSNLFICSTDKIEESPLIAAVKSTNRQFNFSFQIKTRLFDSFGLKSIQPKSFFAIENTSDGFERVLSIIKEDYLNYYKSQIRPQTLLNCYLRSEFTSFVCKLSENKSSFENFLKLKRFSELFYTILLRALPEITNSNSLINSREKENAKNRVDLARFCIEETAEAENRKKLIQTQNVRKFGDTSYRFDK